MHNIAVDVASDFKARNTQLFLMGRVGVRSRRNSGNSPGLPLGACIRFLPDAGPFFADQQRDSISKATQWNVLVASVWANYIVCPSLGRCEGDDTNFEWLGGVKRRRVSAVAKCVLFREAT